MNDEAGSPARADRLDQRIEDAAVAWAAADGEPTAGLEAKVRAVVAELIAALEVGTVRAASPDPAIPGGWRVDAWVKVGILPARA